MLCHKVLHRSFLYPIPSCLGTVGWVTNSKKNSSLQGLGVVVLWFGSEIPQKELGKQTGSGMSPEQKTEH